MEPTLVAETHTVTLTRTDPSDPNPGIGLELEAIDETGEIIIKENNLYPLIQKGDVIIAVNSTNVYDTTTKTPINSYDEVKEMIQHNQDKDSLELEVLRPVNDPSSDNRVAIEVRVVDSPTSNQENTTSPAGEGRDTRGHNRRACLMLILTIVILITIARVVGRSSNDSYTYFKPRGRGIENYPDCHVDRPWMIGDGFCQDWKENYDTEACGWDGTDCLGYGKKKVVEGYPDCRVAERWFIGDGECDSGYNTSACGFDGGDCIQSSNSTDSGTHSS